MKLTEQEIEGLIVHHLEKRFGVKFSFHAFGYYCFTRKGWGAWSFDTETLRTKMWYFIYNYFGRKWAIKIDGY